MFLVVRSPQGALRRPVQLLVLWQPKLQREGGRVIARVKVTLQERRLLLHVLAQLRQELLVFVKATVLVINQTVIKNKKF